MHAAKCANVIWATAHSKYDLARHYRDNIVPLRRQIAEENLLRYNGMLLSVFELLADAREQVTSVNGISMHCAITGSPRAIWQRH